MTLCPLVHRSPADLAGFAPGIGGCLAVEFVHIGDREDECFIGQEAPRLQFVSRPSRVRCCLVVFWRSAHVPARRSRACSGQMDELELALELHQNIDNDLVGCATTRPLAMPCERQASGERGHTS
jgi:hypothetical protein